MSTCKKTAGCVDMGTAAGSVPNKLENVEIIFHEILQYEKQKMLEKVIEQNAGKRILVFVKTKRRADFVAIILSEQQKSTTSIHADRLLRDKELALREFKSGRHCILVATAAALCRNDIKNVDIVVNYDLPKKVDEYMDRIGFAGRGDKIGTAISFFDVNQDAGLAADLRNILLQADQRVPEFLQPESIGNQCVTMFACDEPDCGADEADEPGAQDEDESFC